MRRRLSLAAAAIALCLTLVISSSISDSTVLSAFPQGKSKPDERKRPNKPELESGSPQEERPERQKGYTIGVSVDLVVVHTSVYDKNGHFVGGLKKENFKLFEDGVAQNVSFFSQEDVPVSMGIALDTSGSMRSKIELVNRSALAFI